MGVVKVRGGVIVKLVELPWHTLHVHDHTSFLWRQTMKTIFTDI